MEERAGLLPGNLESRDEGWEGQVLSLSPQQPCPATQHPSPVSPAPPSRSFSSQHGGVGGVVIPKSQCPTSTSVTTTPSATRGLSQ